MANIVLNLGLLGVASLAVLLSSGCDDSVPVPSMPRDPHCSNPMVFFDAGSATLSEAQRKRLTAYVVRDGAVCGINSNPAFKQRLVVIGYTDKTGSEAANEQLGMRRAQHVASGLIELGVSREYLCVGSKGSQSPLVHAAGVEPQNRRVDVTRILFQEPCPAGTVSAEGG
jgi:outer membrane protein OmpA-like peptidoglycan-associated protein